MLKNVIIKKILKSTVFRVVSIVNKIVPKRSDYILLYSGNKGIEFNLAPLKEYLLNHHLDETNKIFCGIESMEYAEKDQDRITYVTHFKAIFLFLRTKHVFYTAGQIPIKPSRTQKVFHLQHGTTFKTCGLLTRINNGDEFFFSACMATSEMYKKVYSTAFNCSEDNVWVNSEPVTDIFWGNFQKYNLGDFKKILLWTPTFRQSDYLGYNDSKEEDLLPLFKESDYDELNKLLKEYGFRLMVKIHPAQDLKKYNRLKYSNLEILSNDDFRKQGYELYNLLPQIDVLIADYSSLFLQFLLLDKPIGFVIPDIEEYSQKRGFAFENPEELMPGYHIRTKDDFYHMLIDLSENKDMYAKARCEVSAKIHRYADGKSCERLILMSEIN